MASTGEKNTATAMSLPPTLDNPKGRTILLASCVSFALVVLFVGLRLVGRWRHRQCCALTLPEGRHNVLFSDLAVVVSLFNTATLLGIIFYGVKWGQGLHRSELSQVQANNALKAFFLYQVFYKFASGISKTATCFILLAIASPHQRAFTLFCRGVVVFILGYCVTCSVVTIFQCRTNFDSNWIHYHDQSKCFRKPPFWYSHAALNMFATLVVAILPWWLFAGLTYRRKYIIGAMLTGLALGEVAFAALRLRGLYKSAHSYADLTYGASTGVIASQLEVSFACVAACVPTVIKISEELFGLFCARVLRLDCWWAKREHVSTVPGARVRTLAGTGYALSSLGRISSSRSSSPSRPKSCKLVLYHTSRLGQDVDDDGEYRRRVERLPGSLRGTARSAQGEFVISSRDDSSLQESETWPKTCG